MRRTLMNWVIMLAIVCGMSFIAPAQADVIYVEGNASGSNDGSSWQNAHTDLQDALSAAANGDDIWVAAGTYTPGDTFQLKNGVGIYGGFGGTESNRDDRNLGANPTILSGGNHVVTASGTDSTAILDGFIITEGSAAPGGGLYNVGGSPTLMNCAFVDNHVNAFVAFGGGMYNENGNPTMTNCTFSANSAQGFGGAAYGGGLYNKSGNPFLANCTFNNNVASGGGGLYVAAGTVTLKNTIIAGNTPDDYAKEGGDILSSGYNLVKKDAGSYFTETSDITGQDPMLDALSNGVHALQTGSPAINAGTCDGDDTPSTDQLGQFRPQGTSCEIGAYEYEEGDTPPTLSVTPNAETIPGTGGTFDMTVENTGGGTLSWEAVSDQDWLTIEGGATGTGDKTLTINCDENPTEAQRTGKITITATGATGSPQTVDVVQEAGSADTPVLSVTPPSEDVSVSAGTFEITIQNTGGGTLTWEAEAPDAWLTIEGAASGTGDKTLSISYKENTTGAERNGSVIVNAAGATPAFKMITVTQAGELGDTPELSVTPTSKTVSVGSGTFDITIQNTGGGTLTWEAEAPDAWLSVEGTASGTGDATVTVTHQSNTTGAERTGSVIVTAAGATPAFKMITVTQAGELGDTPELSVTPTSKTVSVGSGTFDMTIQNAGGGTLNWEADAPDTWLSIEGDVSGTGDATVTISYQANTTGAERTGSVIVTAAGASPAFKMVTVTQSAEAGDTPVLSVTPTSQELTPVGSTFEITIQNAGGGTLSWEAEAPDTWLSIEGDASGTGDGAVTVTYPSNTTDAERSGAIIITAAGATGSPQSVDVTQSAGAGGEPVLSVTPTVSPASAETGTATFTVKNDGTGVMSWTTKSNATWITVTDGDSGTDSGTITVSYEANAGSERVDTITVSAPDAAQSPQFVAVSQAAAENVPFLSVTPISREVDGIDGATTFVVTNTGTPGMAWTASADDDWLTIDDGSAGTDSGIITVSCANNPGETERIGTLTITAADAGNSPQIVQVTQAAGPTDVPVLSVMPTSQNVSGGGGEMTYEVENTGPQGTVMTWTATADDSWLMILSGGSGTNSGTITVSYGTNPGTERTGTLTVTAEGASNSPKKVQLTQAELPADVPVLSVTPASQEVTGESGLITFVVSNAGTGTLNWRAEADVSWLTIKSGASGTDSGAIAVSHEANTGAERTGTLTVTAIGAENSPLTLDVNQVGSVNQAPTDIALSKTRVEEKMPAGTKVGSFSTSDPDSGDTHTHTLVSGSGAADNESFRIQGTHLETADMFDYNVKNSYAIRVKTDDGHGGTFEKAFTITIDDANDDPTDIILDNSALDENQPVGTEVGTYATTDPDESDTHTYTLIISDNASFRIQGNTLSTQKILDYETKNSYSIRVRTDDGRGGSFEKDFSIIVIDNNDKPTDITLDHNLITEGLPIGSAVGAFVATDQDQGDTHTYDLVPGAGGDGNDFFFIEHSTLKANAEFTYIEQNRYNIRVRATDSWDESYDKQFTLMITAAPTAAFAPADGQKDVELNGNITLTFSKPVRLLNDTPLTSVNVDSLILFKKDDPTGKNVPFNATINSGKTVITINPDADMESRQSYHVAIEATVEDYENNPLAPASAVFVTEDTEPPVVTITPMDGTKDVPSTKDIVIEFDEPVRFIDGRQITNINVDGLITFRKTDSDGDDVPFDAVIDTRKMVITIRPGMELESNQTYHMAIGATVEDYSGNSGEAADVTFTVLAIFSDISAELTGVARKSAVAWGDYDNDGDPDILLSGYDYDIPPQGESVAKVYRNTNGTFASIPAGLIGVYFGSVSWGDYDRDSDMDILLTGSNSPKQRSVAKIYRNNNGKFEAVSAGLAGIFQGFAAWKDYDGDADPDILLAGGYETTDGDVTGIAVIYRNDAGQFEKIDVGLTGVYYASGGWGDYDTDGDPDILLTGHDGEARISKVYRNDDGEFTDIEADLPGISSGCAAWGDYNGDGHPDILLTGKTDDGEISKVYRNDAGTFADAYADLPDVYNSSAAWGDYDNDGYLDILLTGENADGKISEVYRYDDETETFTAINAGLIGVSNGAVAWGDYDNDGYPDILLTGEYEETRIAKIYHNNLGNPAEIQDDGHLGNAIMALKILAGMPAPYYGDLDGDGKVGMAEVIDELGRAAGQW